MLRYGDFDSYIRTKHLTLRSLAVRSHDSLQWVLLRRQFKARGWQWSGDCASDRSRIGTVEQNARMPEITS